MGDLFPGAPRRGGGVRGLVVECLDLSPWRRVMVWCWAGGVVKVRGNPS